MLILPLNRIKQLISNLGGCDITDVEGQSQHNSILICFIIENKSRYYNLYIIDMNILNIIVDYWKSEFYTSINNFGTGYIHIEENFIEKEIILENLPRRVNLSNEYEDYITLLIKNYCTLNQLITLELTLFDLSLSAYSIYEEIDSLKDISKSLFNKILSNINSKVNNYPLKFKEEVITDYKARSKC